MMRAFLLAACLMLLGATGAHAQFVCSPPNLLQNGTVADASQVMANFNTLSGCVNSLASFNVQLYGAKGDGVTNDSPAITAAGAACGAAGGGNVIIPATGHSYRIATGIGSATLWPSNCNIIAQGAPFHWGGTGQIYNNTESFWVSSGVWFRCEDTSNPCITLSHDGATVDGLNFWYTQPTPSASACGSPCTWTFNFTPTNSQFTILVNGANFVHLRHIGIANAMNCIDWEGPSSGVFGIFSSMEEMNLGCFNTGTKFRRVDNTMKISHIWYDIWWFTDSSDLLGWTEGNGNVAGMGHKIDWDVGYLADADIDGIEFLNSAIAMQFTDASVVSGFGTVTFAANDWKAVNLTFNEDCKFVALAASTTHVTGEWKSIIAYTDSTTSNGTSGGHCAGHTADYGYGLDFNSDNVEQTISGIRLGLTQTIARIGGGTKGTLHIHGITTDPGGTYSSYAGSGQAFVCNTGAKLDIPHGIQYVVPAGSGAGQVIGGCNLESVTNEGMTISNIVGQNRALQWSHFSTTPTTNVPVLDYDWAVNTSNNNLQIDSYTNGTFLNTPFWVNSGSGTIGANLPTSCSTGCSGGACPTGTLWNSAGNVKQC